MHKDSFPDLVTWIFLHLVVMGLFLGGIFLLIVPAAFDYVNGPVEVNWPWTIFILLFPSAWILLSQLGLSNILLTEDILNKRQARIWAYCLSALWIGLLFYGVIDARISYSKPGYISYDPHLPPAWWSYYLASARRLLPYLVEILLIYWLANSRLQLRLPMCLGWWLAGFLMLGSVELYISQFNHNFIWMPFFVLSLSLINGGFFDYLTRQQSRLFPLEASNSLTSS